MGANILIFLATGLTQWKSQEAYPQQVLFSFAALELPQCNVPRKMALHDSAPLAYHCPSGRFRADNTLKLGNYCCSTQLLAQSFMRQWLLLGRRRRYLAGSRRIRHG